MSYELECPYCEQSFTPEAESLVYEEAEHTEIQCEHCEKNIRVTCTSVDYEYECTKDPEISNLKDEINSLRAINNSLRVLVSSKDITLLRQAAEERVQEMGYRPDFPTFDICVTGAMVEILGEIKDGKHHRYSKEFTALLTDAESLAHCLREAIEHLTHRSFLPEPFLKHHPLIIKFEEALNRLDKHRYIWKARTSGEGNILCGLRSL